MSRIGGKILRGSGQHVDPASALIRSALRLVGLGRRSHVP